MEINDPGRGRPSPVMERIERNQRRANLPSPRVLALLAVIGAAAGGAVSVLRGDSGASASSDQAGPGDIFVGESELDRLDREHDEAAGIPQKIVILGDPDGCIVLPEDQQLQSPLCCPIASKTAGKDPADCPQPRVGDDIGGLSVEGGRAVVLDPWSTGADSTTSQ